MPPERCDRPFPLPSSPAVHTRAPAPRAPQSCQRGEDHEKALIIAPPLPADREPGVGENPEEGVRGVLIRVAHVEPLAADTFLRILSDAGLAVRWQGRSDDRSEEHTSELQSLA